ncbi:hypothetical protein B296_00022817 [Ensete ventricosum]|uniref:Uncharacterized protein n=1 Tax=Ensete ventricosum TaxID=4639 RepID=A0A426YD24_ENSVE|nr:hypothetical protein B296_00022817 [Ensete ventricosum]
MLYIGVPMERHARPMVTSAFRALARHLTPTLSSSPPPPPLFSPLLRRPSKTLLPLALPACRLFGAPSLVRSAAGDRFARLFSFISSDQDLELREVKQSSSSRSEEDEHKDRLLQAQQEKQSRFVPVKSYFLCTRYYAVVVKPNLETWMQGGVDYIVLKSLDIDGVDGMVAEFTDINRGLEKAGTFTMKKRKLFQLVGKANSNLADVILKLGLFER